MSAVLTLVIGIRPGARDGGVRVDAMSGWAEMMIGMILILIVLIIVAAYYADRNERRGRDQDSHE